MTDLLQTLIHDGEQFAEHELPSLTDVARMFRPLVARLEAALPELADRELASLIGESTAAPASVEQPPAAVSEAPAPAATSIQTEPAVAADLSAPERAAELRAEADALDAPIPAADETRAEQLRREADEAESADIQAQAAAGTAAGAEGAPVVSDGGTVRATQDTAAS